MRQGLEGRGLPADVGMSCGGSLFFLNWLGGDGGAGGGAPTPRGFCRIISDPDGRGEKQTHASTS